MNPRPLGGFVEPAGKLDAGQDCMVVFFCENGGTLAV